MSNLGLADIGSDTAELADDVFVAALKGGVCGQSFKLSVNEREIILLALHEVFLV
jgi:hypothetical protein